MATVSKFFSLKVSLCSRWQTPTWIFISFLVLQMPNSCMDFHQIFRICLPQHDMEFSRFWRDSMYNLCHGNSFNIFQSFTLLGFHRSNPHLDLHQIINIYLLQEHLQLIIFFRDSRYICCHGNGFKNFQFLSLWVFHNQIPSWNL